MSDEFDELERALLTYTDGLVLSRRLDHMVRPGSSVTKIVGQKKLPHRTGLLLED